MVGALYAVNYIQKNGFGNNPMGLFVGAIVLLVVVLIALPTLLERSKKKR